MWQADSSQKGARLNVLWLALGLCVPAVAQEQQGPPMAPQPAPSNSAPRLFDSVVGIVGDKAVLESSVRIELTGRIEAYENQTGRVASDEIRRQVRREVLHVIARNEALAQSAKTLPGTTRQQIDQMFDAYMKQFEREQLERAGSVNALSKELSDLGQTWDSFYEERRTELMAQLAEHQSMALQFRDQLGLMVTPKEMLAFYRQNIDQFIDTASTDLDVIALALTDDPDRVQERAEAAAAAWRAGGQANAIAEEFGGIALGPQPRVRDIPEDRRAQELKEFAGTAVKDEVSAPIRRGNSLWILKAVTVRQGRHDTFDDPMIQARIMDLLVRQKNHEHKTKLILKSQQQFQLVTPRGPRTEPDKR